MPNRSELTRKGVARARELGRKPGPPVQVSDEQIRTVIGLSTKDAAKAVGLSRSQYIRRRRQIEDAR